MKLRNKKEEGALFEHELEEHAPGLICLTGGDDGLLATALARGGFDEALGAVERLTQIFGRNNVYIELQRHFHREEEAAIALQLKSPTHSNSRCSQPMVFVMPLRAIANLPMCSCRFAIIARWPRLDGFSHAIPSVI